MKYKSILRIEKLPQNGNSTIPENGKTLSKQFVGNSRRIV